MRARKLVLRREGDRAAGEPKLKMYPIIESCIHQREMEHFGKEWHQIWWHHNVEILPEASGASAPLDPPLEASLLHEGCACGSETAPAVQT